MQPVRFHLSRMRPQIAHESSSLLLFSRLKPHDHSLSRPIRSAPIVVSLSLNAEMCAADRRVYYFAAANWLCAYE